MYPSDGIRGYPREQFIDDLLREHETEVRNCLRKGACKVQIDFTEGRLAIDPSGDLLNSFIHLNSPALSRFGDDTTISRDTAFEKIGVPGIRLAAEILRE